MIARAEPGSANVNLESLQACAIFRGPIQNCPVSLTNLVVFTESNGRAGALNRAIGKSVLFHGTDIADRHGRAARTIRLLPGLDGERLQNGLTKNRIREMSNT